MACKENNELCENKKICLCYSCKKQHCSMLSLEDCQTKEIAFVHECPRYTK